MGRLMEEFERRVIAHELALVEVSAHVGREQMLAGIKAIRAGIAACRRSQ